jgi:tetratricopeptide (TPR) repeat protein
MLRNALAANPNNAQILALSAIGELHGGSLDRVLELTRRAIAMSPGDPGTPWALTVNAHVAMARGDYEEALAEAGRSIAIHPGFLPTYWMLIAANAHLGRLDEARSWLTQFEARSPGVTVSTLRDGQTQKDRSRIDPILVGLQIAGLAEG